MELDLNARSAKWKREQEKQKERARRLQQTEALKRAAAARAQEAERERQAEQRRRRLAQEEARERQLLEDQRLTGGVTYATSLRPVPTPGDGDRITLPPSALAALDPQNASDLGAFTFALSLTDGEQGSPMTDGGDRRRPRTHAGVLEFTAEEGTVGIPPKVAATLFVEHTNIPKAVHVRFVRLDKGKFAALRPRGEGFGDRALDFKHTLERALRAHATLTIGDTVFVRHGRQTFELIVAELQPEDAVNILNTDLEVALLPSESVVRAQEEEKRRVEAAERAAEAERERLRLREERLAALPAEPPAEDRRQAKMILRLPDGSQATRRIAHSSPLREVLQLVHALTGEAPDAFQVVATYPRRVFGPSAFDQTLQELGLNGRQESLFVERIAAVVTASDSSAAGATSPNSMKTTKTFPDDWQEAKKALERNLDEALNPTATTPIHALEPIMPVVATADDSTKWEAQLKELETMGFVDRELNIQILERYQGRLLRVVNYLSELPTTTTATTTPTSTAEPMVISDDS